MTDYPYMISNNKISQIIEKIQQAARPKKFTIEVLRSLGFTSTNDRAFIPLAKKLGFLADDGTPTALYDQLRDKNATKLILAAQIKSLYSELYAINVEIHNASEMEIKGAIGRVTGKDEEGVSRIYNTFKSLCKNADFTGITYVAETEEVEMDDKKESDTGALISPKSPQFHYNIQIHLPVTTDISVYNAILEA